MQMNLARRVAVGGLWVVGLAGGLGCAHADARLECELTYGGDTQTLSVKPVEDPYPVPSVDVAGRFRFKPVLVGQGGRLQHVSLYVYAETERQPVLIQQATYLPPFPASGALTGRQHLYAGPMERELIYSCTLSGVAP